MELNNTRILVTGASGFIGANLLYYFNSHFDVELHAMSRSPSKAWRLQELKKNKKVSFHNTDLTDLKQTRKILKKIKPDIVVHCATYGMYLGKEKDKFLNVRTNIDASVRLFLDSADAGVRKFIHTGTASEYGLKDLPMKEDMFLEPVNTYGATKAGATILISQLAKEAKLPCVLLRIFAPYGPFETGSRLIPSLILSYLDCKKIKLSSGTPVRDFIHIDDVMSAYTKAVGCDDSIHGDVFNIGSGRQYSIAETVATVKKIFGSPEEPEYGVVQTVQTEPAVWVADRSLAREKLGWEPALSLEDGLKINIEWFRANRQLYQ